ncbi:hypothetical protein [Streptomyces sp. NPDC090083]|uniref:hypothetical protein n=1 Tax=Streptomyces sp. NPDC090083 TaxID=3365941 RepID=UPI00381CB13F
MHSPRHLTAGTQVTRIAAGLGCDGPAAFTPAIRALLGRQPSDCLTGSNALPAGVGPAHSRRSVSGA